LGRTDDSEGLHVDELTVVGYDYTDLPPVFARAGAQTGVRTTKHPINNDAYFGRADSVSFARAGVPAATAAAPAFEYPDYHQPGDEWQKLDYNNMANLDQTIALDLTDIANSAEAPKWDETNPKTAQFVKARAATMTQK
jgi:Zn-dependent M28 family amino/carboxypeptidase